MAVFTIPNSGFESGDFSNWAATPAIPGNPDFYIQSSGEGGPFEGTYFAANRTEGEIVLWNETFFDCDPTSLLTVSCYLKPTRGSDRGTVRIFWFDEDENPITPAFTEAPHNTPGHVQGTGGWRKSYLNNVAIPSGAAKFRVGAYIRSYTRSIFGIDAFEAKDNISATVDIISPEDGAVFEEGTTIQVTASVNIFQEGSGDGGGGGSWSPPTMPPYEEVIR